MLTTGEVTLRPLEPEDIDALYAWRCDLGIEALAGWGPIRSKAAFHESESRRILEPAADHVRFGIQFEGVLVGYVDLGLIDLENRRACLGLVVGDRGVWGKGVGGGAVRIALDYAFTPLNLDRVTAEVYPFNLRSLRLMEAVGFTREGVHRAHEVHNGTRVDLVQFGLLRNEFYSRYATIFPLPESRLDR